MRIWILSDLHLDAGRPWSPPRIPEADVAVVAGDVCEGLPAAVRWSADAIGRHMAVVLVAGNHEYYRGQHGEELAAGRAAADSLGVHLLEDAAVVIDGVRFCGATLWTDYALEGTERRAAAMDAARRGLNDHRVIGWSRQPPRRFGPEEALALHEASRAFLDRALAEGGLPQVVVTHHGPAPRSVAPAFAGDPLNPAFVSDLGGLIEARRPALWVHGHVHATRDYRQGSTRVLCNPHGYGSENPTFQEDLVVEVGT